MTALFVFAVLVCFVGTLAKVKVDVQSRSFIDDAKRYGNMNILTCDESAQSSLTLSQK